MVRRFPAFLAAAVILLATAGVAAAAPIKLARHPDYHAGKIVFSYLGDLWVANEDGTGAHRVTDHTARDIYPRFSPDGKWIAFSSNRYGNNDVFVIPAGGRRGEAADVPQRQRRSRRLDPRRQERRVPRLARTRRVSERRDAAHDRDRRRTGTAAADRLGLVGQLLARRQVARLQPPSVDVVAPALSRQLRRGSVDRRISPTRATRSCSPTSATTATGRCGAPTTASTSSADPLPNEKTVKPGSPEVRASVNNIYKIPAKGGQPVQVTKHADGSLFWPSMSSDGKTIVYEDNFGIWKLDVASGRSQRDQDRPRHRRQGQRDRVPSRSATKSTRSTSRRRAAAPRSPRAGRS